jgi:membrane-associated phospholipid phosphatase
MNFERLLFLMTRPWVIISYFILMILLYFYLDQWVAYYFHRFDLRGKCPPLVWLTHLGSNVLYLSTLFILAVFFRYIRPEKVREARCWFLWLCVLIPSSVCFVLKILFGRARPDLLFDQHLYGLFGLKWHTLFWSLPSGHSTTIMGLIFGLTVLFPRYFYLLLLAGLMVVSSRVLLTAHYLSDVMVAGYLALLEVGLLTYGLRRKPILNLDALVECR